MFLLCNFILQAQLNPKNGYSAIELFPEYSTFSAFDIYGELLYANDGDTIRCFNIESGEQIKKYAKPSDYTTSTWPSFLTISPDGKSIWAGYTEYGNVDDRIYEINIESGIWTLKANMSGNFDLEFWNDKMLVSGLNSTDWSSPNSIFLLDTTGANNHKKIIETGGNSAGLGIDKEGNVYYASYSPKKLYKWISDSITKKIENDEPFLELSSATKLSDLHAGAYDCDADDAGNIVFNSNGSEKVLAKWNGTAGDGYNFDTVAFSTGGYDWLTMVKTQGDINAFGEENAVYALNMGHPITKIFKPNQLAATNSLPILSELIGAEEKELNLNNYFEPVNAGETITYKILSISTDSVAGATLKQDTLIVVEFLKAGQTNIWIEASLNGQKIKGNLIVGVQPKYTENVNIASFDNIPLTDEAYWNGSDGTGSIESGLCRFINNYDNSMFIWNGWACSNTSDVTTGNYTNQYSAITGIGFDSQSSNNKNYGISYVNFYNDGGYSRMTFTDNKPHKVNGLYVTNTTYTALTLENGSGFSKIFGGETGNDPDYYKLLIWGKKDDVETEKIEFYLSGYRFEDNSKDYIIKTWQWIDLSSLGLIDSLLFSVESSDVGAYGINTPTYFAADDIHVAIDSKVSDFAVENTTLYPNPSNGIFYISNGSNNAAFVNIFNVTGKLIYSNSNYFENEKIDISNYPSGVYFVEIKTDKSVQTHKFVKE